MLFNIENTHCIYCSLLGYQEHLPYRSADGSYRLWKHDNRGACFWLTAFVVKALSHAQHHIYIDHERLQERYKNDLASEAVLVKFQ